MAAGLRPSEHASFMQALPVLLRSPVRCVLVSIMTWSFCCPLSGSWKAKGLGFRVLPPMRTLAMVPVSQGTCLPFLRQLWCPGLSQGSLSCPASGSPVQPFWNVLFILSQVGTGGTGLVVFMHIPQQVLPFASVAGTSHTSS